MRKLLLPLLVFALVLSSCQDDLTSLNEDPKGASDVPAEPLFSNALVNLGTLNTSVDYNRNMFKHMAQYWAQTTYNDESSYDLTDRTIPSNYWGVIYRDVLTDLQESSSLVEEDELNYTDAQKQNMQAQIDIVEVMAYYQLVTTFGNVPYSEALDSDNPSPAYDAQTEIYGDLMSRLNTAISNLDASAAGFSTSADVYYRGEVAGWQRFANSLKVRMAMTVVDNPPSGIDPQAAVEDALPNAFTSNDHNLALNFTSTPPHTNPVWEDVIQSGRDDFVPANTLIDEMNNLNDPRRSIHFTTIGGQYEGGLYGAQNDYSNYSHIKGPLIEPDFEGLLLGYEEVEFLRAEAAARGWNVTGTAETHYNNAIEADMQYWDNASTEEEITPQDITDYQTQSDVLFPTGASEAEQLKAIAEQKWLALYMQGQQAWIEWRRLDHPTFYYTDVDNDDVTSEDDIPVRFTYPVDEQNLNQANWEEAESSIGGDETSTHLFWDVADATSVN